MEEAFLPAIILIMKRMRDTAGLTSVLPSIILTALACELYKDTGCYADDLLSLIKNMSNKLNDNSRPLDIRIPVVDENLADNLDTTKIKAIASFFTNSHSELEAGFKKENIDKLRGVLSSDFPTDIDEYPYPELQSLRSKDWSLALDGTLEKTEIFAESKVAQSHATKKRWFKFFTKGESIVFTAQCDHDPHGVSVRWQVINSPESEQRRGDLFKAKKLNGSRSANKFVNEETERYLGTHWIKYFVVDQYTNKVIALGQRWFVEVDFDE